VTETTIGGAQRPADPPSGAGVNRTAAGVDRLMRCVVQAAAGCSIILVLLVITFLSTKAYPVLKTPGLVTFFGSTAWEPDGVGFGNDQTFGALMPIFGSLIVVGLALIIAIPLAVATALVLEETNPVIGERYLRPAVDLFLGIPSVVYGYLGFIALVPILAHLAPSGKDGSGVLAAAIVLSIMIVPTIAALSADGVRAVPRSLKEASMALGATRWQTISRVILPAARANIVSGVVLGLARAMGEALAVAFVIGDVNNLPPFRDYGLHAFFVPSTTMTVTITDGINNLAVNPDGTAARYALALVLLAITFGSIMVVRTVNRRAPRVVA
jgi:phosphate transport system permease protein